MRYDEFHDAFLDGTLTIQFSIRAAVNWNDGLGGRPSMEGLGDLIA
jgi:hypothetical protein